MEEALAVQEAARRAMAGEAAQAATAHASADEPHRALEAQHRDEHAEADAGLEAKTQEQPATGPAAAEPERPHVGLAEIAELPEVSPCPWLFILCSACEGREAPLPVYRFPQRQHAADLWSNLLSTVKYTCRPADHGVRKLFRISFRAE